MSRATTARVTFVAPEQDVGLTMKLTAGPSTDKMTTSALISVARLCDLAPEGDSVTSVAWAERGHLVSVGTHRGTVQVWDVTAGKRIHTLEGHTARVGALVDRPIAWSPHHHGVLASGGDTADRCIRFWNTLTGQPMQYVDTGSQVCNLACSKHLSELVTHGYSQNQILIWKYPSLAQVAQLTGHSYRVLYLAMLPDGESIETRSVLNLFTSLRHLYAKFIQ
ncbi:hypothetical protein DAPPUDRAFT_267911 [Daphnia pulex]|uniref:Anaphase-promoting complex subunit 4-like WD40 domain-containing protein n=1 Tax=Daphnia pulex TaxID=6669 RepID=E9HX40_DAPPU|nr:hypothetical protein DAPPUDRAFT_267911 [Daphnia pulex]|eukprot:EFX63692.1 hypothetical protein DAPPUDRAFT_267911 [Daphnia pulex]